MERQNISSGSRFEKPIGFSRSVRMGKLYQYWELLPLQKMEQQPILIIYLNRHKGVFKLKKPLSLMLEAD